MPEHLSGKATWLGPDIQGSDRWIYRFTDQDVAVIDAALSQARKTGVALAGCRREDFPLGPLVRRLDGMLDEIENGLGLYLFRGFPVDRYTTDELRFIFWGLGLYCGTAISQSKRGDLMGDVRNIGTPHDGTEFRGYTSNGELTYHSDAADVTALFCLHPAKAGGLSRIVSIPAVHNEMLKRHPDLAAALYEPCTWGLQGNEKPGESGFYTQPVFAVHEGRFAGRYTRTHIRSAELTDGQPNPSPAQLKAFDMIDAICAQPEFQLTMMFEPGDIQFLNNHLTLHMRTEFEDHGEEARKRHLLRLWLAPPNSRALGPGFKPFYREVRAGSVRGGFPGHGGAPVFTTLPIE